MEDALPRMEVTSPIQEVYDLKSIILDFSDLGVRNCSHCAILCYISIDQLRSMKTTLIVLGGKSIYLLADKALVRL